LAAAGAVVERDAGCFGCVILGIGLSRHLTTVEKLLDTPLEESAIFLSRKRLPKSRDGMWSKSHTSALGAPVDFLEAV
jgi:hypothetical protein